MIGCLGDIIFEVSDRRLMTPDNMQMSGSVRIAEHQRAGTTTLTEFTGIDTDKFSLSIKLVEVLGVDVNGMLTRIQRHMERGAILPLVLGTRTYGRYRWQIKSYSAPFETFDGAGNLLSATVTLNLVEYLAK